MVKVSILTAVYNPKEEHLKECLDSLCSQTLKDVEIILVDNGSTDNNHDICVEYANKYLNIKLIVFPKNQGFVSAISEALNFSSGEYIQIVDSDDFIRKDTCEKLYNKAIETSSDLILFGADTFNNKTKKYYNDTFYGINKLYKKFGNNSFLFEDASEDLFQTPLQDWNKFIKRSLIFQNNNFFEKSLQYVLADCVFSIRNFINAKKIIIEPEILYSYRTDISTSVVKGYKKVDCPYLEAPFIFIEIINDIIKNTNLKYCNGLIYTIIFHLFLYFEMVNKKHKKWYFQKMKKFLLQKDYNIFSISSLRPYRWKYKLIKIFSYEMYEFINLFLKIDEFENYVRIKILGITLYKKQILKDLIKYKFLGIINIKIKSIKKN